MSAKKTNSCLRQRDLAAMQIFTWDSLVSELESNAPTLHQVLKACVTVSRRLRAQKRCGSKKKVRSHHPESAAVLGLCAAVLLRHRNHSMSLVQRILSVILHSGHAGKQVHVHVHVFYVRKKQINAHVQSSSLDDIRTHASRVLVRHLASSKVAKLVRALHLHPLVVCHK